MQSRSQLLTSVCLSVCLYPADSSFTSRLIAKCKWLVEQPPGAKQPTQSRGYRPFLHLSFPFISSLLFSALLLPSTLRSFSLFCSPFLPSTLLYILFFSFPPLLFPVLFFPLLSSPLPSSPLSSPPPISPEKDSYRSLCACVLFSRVLQTSSSVITPACPWPPLTSVSPLQLTEIVTRRPRPSRRNTRWERSSETATSPWSKSAWRGE